MKSLLNRAALGCFRLLPTQVAQHLLFLLRHDTALTDRWGYHIRPIHYYEPLPDFGAITPAQLERRREFPAINFDWPGQLRLLAALAASYRDELAELAAQPEPVGFPFDNEYFAGLDAAVYYALIRHLKPARVIEIGSGYSTRIAAKALARNRQAGNTGRLTCIEPYPQPRLTEAKLDIELIATPVEQLDLEIFSTLAPNDILFIDSSHTVKFGSDVCYEFLEILPRLRPGVWVHVHDIFFPHDYPAEWLVEKRIAFTEQYLLEAFLAFNSAFIVVAANHWLCLDHPEAVECLWPSSQRRDYSGHASFWMRKAN